MRHNVISFTTNGHYDLLNKLKSEYEFEIDLLTKDGIIIKCVQKEGNLTCTEINEKTGTETECELSKKQSTSLHWTVVTCPEVLKFDLVENTKEIDFSVIWNSYPERYKLEGVYNIETKKFKYKTQTKLFEHDTEKIDDYKIESFETFIKFEYSKYLKKK